MKALALDISTTATGWAFGEIGKTPESCGKIFRPKGMKEEPQIQDHFVSEVLTIVSKLSAQCVLAEEMSFFSGARSSATTARMLSSLRGAIMYALRHEKKIDMLPLNIMSCRSKAGVDLRKIDEQKNKIETPIKLRAMMLLSTLGFDTADEDIADAAIVLLAAGKLIDAPEERQDEKPKLAW